MVATVKAKGLKEQLSALTKRRKDMVPTIQKTIDDTTKQLRTQASKEIRTQLAVQAGALKKRLRRKLAFRRGLSGTLYVDGKRVKLSRFKNRQTNLGVVVQVYKGSSGTLYPDAFGPKRLGLKGGIYVRQGEARFPIAAQPGPVLSEFAVATGAVERVKAKIPEILKKNIARRVRLLELKTS